MQPESIYLKISLYYTVLPFWPVSGYSYLRQRKDRFDGDQYSLSIMNNNWTISKTTVADLLAATPKAFRFFIDQGTGCAICPLARFCTLKEVISAYFLNEDDFLEKLARLDVHKL